VRLQTLTWKDDVKSDLRTRICFGKHSAHLGYVKYSWQWLTHDAVSSS